MRAPYVTIPESRQTEQVASGKCRLACGHSSPQNRRWPQLGSTRVLCADSLYILCLSGTAVNFEGVPARRPPKNPASRWWRFTGRTGPPLAQPHARLAAGMLRIHPFIDAGRASKRCAIAAPPSACNSRGIPWCAGFIDVYLVQPLYLHLPDPLSRRRGRRGRRGRDSSSPTPAHWPCVSLRVRSPDYNEASLLRSLVHNIRPRPSMSHRYARIRLLSLFTLKSSSSPSKLGLT
ncbi:hypothetical protein C8Q70DRAFT_745743 [Cubamyces menziesii]|nr:hypothetical protein C8Q70DRAFT_745743 [Cubamyces menziesii]